MKRPEHDVSIGISIYGEEDGVLTALLADKIKGEREVVARRIEEELNYLDAGAIVGQYVRTRLKDDLERTIVKVLDEAVTRAVRDVVASLVQLKPEAVLARIAEGGGLDRAVDYAVRELAEEAVGGLWGSFSEAAEEKYVKQFGEMVRDAIVASAAKERK